MTHRARAGRVLRPFGFAQESLSEAERAPHMPGHGAGVERPARVLAARSGHRPASAKASARSGRSFSEGRSRDLPLDSNEGRSAGGT